MQDLEVKDAEQAREQAGEDEAVTPEPASAEAHEVAEKTSEANAMIETAEADVKVEETAEIEPIAPEPETEAEPESAVEEPQPEPLEEVIVEDFVVQAPQGFDEDAQLKAIIEAAIYITDEPLTPLQIASALGKPAERVNRLLDELSAEYALPGRGLSIREIAGGFKMATKAEHHEAIRSFVKNLKPPLKLSLAALETLAVIAYKQPVTGPEIMEIRGVQGLGVLKTLLDRKLIAAGGRKQVVGKPILYKTTKEFLVQFGLKDLTELPTLKEFEELGRLALTDEAPAEPAPHSQTTPGETAGDPSQAPIPIEEPGPEEPPERDPDPTIEPGPPTDPERQPVKGEGGQPNESEAADTAEPAA